MMMLVAVLDVYGSRREADVSVTAYQTPFTCRRHEDESVDVQVVALYLVFFFADVVPDI